MHRPPTYGGGGWRVAHLTSDTKTQRSYLTDQRRLRLFDSLLIYLIGHFRLYGLLGSISSSAPAQTLCAFFSVEFLNLYIDIF